MQNRMHWGWLLLLLTILVSWGCQPKEEDSQVSADGNPPSLSDSSLSFSNVSTTSLTLSWTKATDEASQGDLLYHVYYSTSDNLSSVADVKANGTSAGDEEKDIDNLAITGLTSGTTYYFNVLVGDPAGNQTVYTASSQTTGTATSVPTHAASSVSFTDTDKTSGQVGGTLSITKATDESDVTHYVLYWGSSSSAKLSGQDAITNLAVTGADQTYDVSTDTSLPSGATHFLVFTKNSTGEMSSGVSASITDVTDSTAPTVGGSGTISVSTITTSSLILTWTKATDDVSAQSSLLYKTYKSSSNNLSNATDAQANGTQLMDWTSNLNGVGVTSLSSGTTYYFNTLVKDEAGNISAYTSISATTNSPAVYLFRGPDNTGNLGGRSGADSLCSTEYNSTYSSLGCSTIKGFVSISATDEIQDMPTNYSLPTSYEIKSSTGGLIANNWADLLDYSIGQTLNAAGVSGTTGWYSGSNGDGSLNTDNCSNFSSTAGLGATGGFTSTSSGWMLSGSGSCSSTYKTLCVCW